LVDSVEGNCMVSYLIDTARL